MNEFEALILAGLIAQEYEKEQAKAKKKNKHKNKNKNPAHIVRYDLGFDRRTEPSTTNQIPEIKDVQFYNQRATVMTFADGTKTRAICDKEDQFNESAGIAICIAKRAMGSAQFHNELVKHLTVSEES